MTKSALPPDHVRAYGILTQPAGQLIMDDLARSFGTGNPAFLCDPKGHFDVTRAAIRDGQRQVILHIEKCIKQATSENPIKPSKATTE